MEHSPGLSPDSKKQDDNHGPDVNMTTPKPLINIETEHPPGTEHSTDTPSMLMLMEMMVELKGLKGVMEAQSKKIDDLCTNNSNIGDRVTKLENTPSVVDIDEIMDKVVPKVREIINSSIGPHWQREVMESIRLNETKIVFNSGSELFLNNNNDLREFCKKLP